MSIPTQVSEFYERLWHLRDRSALTILLDDKLVFRGSLGAEAVGIEAFWTYLTSVRDALDDYRCEILNCVTEGDAAFAQMRFVGTHVGPFRGFDPTGKAVHWLGAALFTIAGGKIVRIWVLGDLAGLDNALRENRDCLTN
ncbi:MAG: ester cyclase [Opitutus sp.]